MAVGAGGLMTLGARWAPVELMWAGNDGQLRRLNQRPPLLHLAKASGNGFRPPPAVPSR